MAIKLKFDNNHRLIKPTIVLASRGGSKICVLPCNDDIVVTEGMNDPSEITFTVNKSQCKSLSKNDLYGLNNIYFDLADGSGSIERIRTNIYYQKRGYVQDRDDFVWNEISNFKFIWVVDWDEWFEIKVDIDDGDDCIKTIQGKSISESELSQINIYDFEVNTENDIARDDYEPTVLYSENKNVSLLDMLLDKAPHYTIKFVSPSLKNLQRVFKFDKKNIHDCFNDIAKEINCLFVYDNSSNRTTRKPKREISVYDLEDYCLECGERGTFGDTCSNCYSENIVRGYGEDTSVFVSVENLTDEIRYSTNVDSVKNCFFVEGGDDLMTDTVRMCNPNGSSYIWYFSELVRNEMSDELSAALQAYDENYEYYSNEYDPGIYSKTEAVKYNQLIDKYPNSGFMKIDNSIIGYNKIISTYYDIIDFYYYLYYSMMPSRETQNTDATKECLRLNHNSLSPIAIKDTNSISLASVDNVILTLAKIKVDKRYQVKIKESSLNSANTVWTGKFTVTNYSDDEDKSETDAITVNVTKDYEKYVKQNIEKTISQAKQVNEDNPTDISSLFDLDDDRFKLELKKYGLSSLRNFYNVCQGVLDTLIQQGASNPNSQNPGAKEVYQNMYLPYYNKKNFINDEIIIREQEVAIVYGKYAADETLETPGIRNIVENEVSEIKNRLNFENALGDSWVEFLSYRRDDVYKNENFISNGLSNAELFSYAQELIETAKKDIVKSATLQHSISATLKNLLVMKEFVPIVDKFEKGNFIRVKVDNNIYKLRLLNYRIEFESLEDISVEFSDVTITANGLTDVQDVLSKANDMATTFSHVSRQAKSGSDSNNLLQDWVNRGLALTNMKIINNAESQDISWDEHGILCRQYDPFLNEYDDKQLKIINKGMYFTDDNWVTSKAGFGDFYYWNPQTKEIEEGYGVVADTIIGDIILGENIGIYNRNGSMTMDERGLEILSNVTDGEGQTTFAIRRIDSEVDGVQTTTDLMYIDSDGNLVINGTVKFNSNGNVMEASDVMYGTNLRQEFTDLIRTNSDDLRTSIAIKAQDVLTEAKENLQSYQADVGQWLSFDDSGLTIGSSQSVFSTKIDNNRMAFYEEGSTVAYFSNKQMFIKDAIISNSLYLGHFFFMPRDDGGVSIAWEDEAIDVDDEGGAIE